MKHTSFLMGLAIAGVFAVSHAQAQEGLGCTPDEERQVATKSVYIDVALNALRRSFTHISPDVASMLDSLPSDELRQALLSEKGLSSTDESEFRKLAAANMCKFTNSSERRELEAFYATPEGRDLLDQQYALLGRVVAFQQMITKVKLSGIISKLP